MKKSIVCLLSCAFIFSCFNLLDCAAPGPRVPSSNSKLPHSSSVDSGVKRPASVGSLRRSASSGNIKRTHSSGSLCGGAIATSRTSVIEPVKNLETLRTIVSRLSQGDMDDTLFVFDIHGTLVFNKCSGCLQLQNIRCFEEYMQFCCENRSLDSVCDGFEDLCSKVLVATNDRDVLIDDSILEIMRVLNNSNCKALVASASNYGRFGVIGSLADFKISTLESLGFCIQSKFFDEPAKWCKFDGFGENPLYKKSFLFCLEKKMKADFIINLCGCAGWFPKRVVWLEDDIEVLRVAQKVFSNCEEFVGLHYCAVKKYFREYNPVLVQDQVNFFLGELDYALNEEAKCFSGSQPDLFYHVVEKYRSDGKRLWRDDDSFANVVDERHCCGSKVCAIV